MSTVERQTVTSARGQTAHASSEAGSRAGARGADLKQSLRGRDLASQLALLAPGGEPLAATGSPATGDPKQALIAWLAVPEQRAALVAGLAKNDRASVSSFEDRTKAIRPLPPEATSVVDEAWAEANAGDAPDKTTLATLLGLRYGTKVNADAPSVDHYRQVWSALGRLPAHHVESPNAQRNDPDYRDDKRHGDEDPLRSIILDAPGPNESEGGTAGYGGITLTMGEAGAKRNRFPRETSVEKDGQTKSNFATLPKDLGKAADQDGLRQKFAGAGVTNLSHSLLHEMGHALDRARGIMDRPEWNLPQWNNCDKSAAATIVGQLGLPDDHPELGKDGPKRKQLVAELEKSGPAALANAKPSDPLWVGNEALLAAAQQSVAGRWLATHVAVGGARAFIEPPADIGGRVYQYGSSGEAQRWASYSFAYRQQRSVSDYSWKTHREWFAESYAVYYDSEPRGTLLEARDPTMKKKLDQLHTSSNIKQGS